MATQINPALARLWLPGGSRQFGYIDPVLIDLPNAGELRALDYLETGISDKQTEHLGKLAKLDQTETENLLTRLASSLLRGQGRTDLLSPEFVEQHFADLAAIYLESKKDPEQVIKRRQKSTVFVSQLDPSGITISRGLAQSFVGKIISMDQLKVGLADVQPLGHRKESLGQGRVRSAQLEIPQARVEMHSRPSGAMNSVELAVIIATDVINPDSYQMWMAREIPHLAVVFDEGGVKVTPLVLPGITACLACFETAHFQEDENWVAIAPQLLNLDRSLADAAMLLFASSVVTNLCLHLLDGETVQDHPGRGFTRSGALIEFPPPETNCGCRQFRL